MERSQEVAEAVRDWFDVVSRRDGTAAGNAFSREEPVLVIGTDPEEWWSGSERVRELFRAQLSEATADFGVSVGEITAASEGDLGWAAARAAFHFGDQEVPARWSAVARREDGRWRFVHVHASLGVPNEESLGQEFTTG